MIKRGAPQVIALLLTLDCGWRICVLANLGPKILASKSRLTLSCQLFDIDLTFIFDAAACIRSVYFHLEHLLLRQDNRVGVGAKSSHVEKAERCSSFRDGQSFQGVHDPNWTPYFRHYSQLDAVADMSAPSVPRENTLRDILAHFADKPTESYERPRILSIWRLAGEGKSHLALEVSLRSREIYSGVYWINASTDVTAMQSFDALAAEMGF